MGNADDACGNAAPSSAFPVKTDATTKSQRTPLEAEGVAGRPAGDARRCRTGAIAADSAPRRKIASVYATPTRVGPPHRETL